MRVKYQNKPKYEKVPVRVYLYRDNGRCDLGQIVWYKKYDLKLCLDFLGKLYPRLISKVGEGFAFNIRIKPRSLFVKLRLDKWYKTRNDLRISIQSFLRELASKLNHDLKYIDKRD